jgi:hypothetical protein
MRYKEIIAEDFTVPQVWYHSTESDPVVVAKDFAANNIDPTGAVKTGDEYWFSDDWEASRYYGENTVRAKLRMTNPLLVTREEFERIGRGPSTYWAAKARQEGHDGVVINDIMDGDQFSTVCAVFSPSQIEAVPHSKWNDDTQGFDLYEARRGFAPIGELRAKVFWSPNHRDMLAMLERSTIGDLRGSLLYMKDGSVMLAIWPARSLGHWSFHNECFMREGIDAESKIDIRISRDYALLHDERFWSKAKHFAGEGFFCACQPDTDPNSVPELARLFGPTRPTTGMMNESVQQWPDRLDQDGLVEYVRSIAPEGELEDEHDEYILEMFDHPDGAHLKRIPIAGLKPNGGYYEKKKENRYHDMASEAPPIIVNPLVNMIADGNHRVRVALRKGETTILAYVLEWDDE